MKKRTSNLGGESVRVGATAEARQHRRRSGVAVVEREVVRVARDGVVNVHLGEPHADRRT